MNIKLLSPLAKIPEKAHNTDAGLDLSSIESYLLLPGERKLFKTGISLAIPPGYYGRIAPRSGLAHKYGIQIGGGVIDENYRGEIGVILFNSSSGEQARPLNIEVGSRIAQIIFERYYTFDFVEVRELDETVRGEGGYGSSGV